MERIIEVSKEIVELLAESGLSDVGKSASLEVASVLVTATAISDAADKVEWVEGSNAKAETLSMKTPVAGVKFYTGCGRIDGEGVGDFEG